MIALALMIAAASHGQGDVKIQVERDYEAADATLNAQYRATMAVAAKDDANRAGDLKTGAARPDGDPTYQAALLASQRAWLAYRDAQCRVASFEYRGGTDEGMAGGLCLTDLTRRRTAELKQLQASLGNR